MPIPYKSVTEAVVYIYYELHIYVFIKRSHFQELNLHWSIISDRDNGCKWKPEHRMNRMDVFFWKD